MAAHYTTPLEKIEEENEPHVDVISTKTNPSCLV